MPVHRSLLLFFLIIAKIAKLEIKDFSVLSRSIYSL